MESFLPELMQQMFKTNVGEDNEAVLTAIKKAGGSITHTNIIRKMQYRMKAQQTKEILASLKESEQIEELRDNLSHRYILAGKPNA
jgi:hypothetical protein